MQTNYLDTQLMVIAGKKPNPWTIRNAVEGVQIFGGIGSGKTSGSGRLLALKYLEAGFGGLVLTAKPDEKTLWQEYCKATGRLHDLIVIEPGGEYAFNFLDYETSKSSTTALTENIVQVLKTVINASEEKATGQGKDPFWESALDLLIFNVIDLCKLAYGKVSIQKMYDIVQTIPKDGAAPETDEDKKKGYHAAFEAANANVNATIKKWQVVQGKAYLKKLAEQGVYDDVVSQAVPDARILKIVHQFFKEDYTNLAEKTRSVIDFSFSSFLYRLLRDPVYTLFCNRPSNVTPEDCFLGKILLINLPVKTYHKIGRDTQIMFKYIWQRAMEKRDVDHGSKPVFLWADEAQNFLHEHDAEYQATARSSRIATVYISQNLPNYYANMGGAKYQSRVQSFLGTLATKIFHANADIETNKYASEIMGDGFFQQTSRTNNLLGADGSTTKSTTIDRIVRPEYFSELKTGGGKNDCIVEGYIHLQSGMLSNGLNFTKIAFNQNYKNPNII